MDKAEFDMFWWCAVTACQRFSSVSMHTYKVKAYNTREYKRLSFWSNAHHQLISPSTSFFSTTNSQSLLKFERQSHDYISLYICHITLIHSSNSSSTFLLFPNSPPFHGKQNAVHKRVLRFKAQTARLRPEWLPILSSLYVDPIGLSLFFNNSSSRSIVKVVQELHKQVLVKEKVWFLEAHLSDNYSTILENICDPPKTTCSTLLFYFCDTFLCSVFSNKLP